jgi:hypothetical protein
VTIYSYPGAKFLIWWHIISENQNTDLCQPALVRIFFLWRGWIKLKSNRHFSLSWQFTHIPGAKFPIGYSWMKIFFFWRGWIKLEATIILVYRIVSWEFTHIPGVKFLIWRHIGKLKYTAKDWRRKPAAIVHVLCPVGETADRVALAAAKPPGYVQIRIVPNPHLADSNLSHHKSPTQALQLCLSAFPSSTTFHSNTHGRSVFDHIKGLQRLAVVCFDWTIQHSAWSEIHLPKPWRPRLCQGRFKQLRSH